MHLAWNVGTHVGTRLSRRLQWGQEWNKCSQDGQFEVEQIPTRSKVDIALFSIICCAADKQYNSSVALYENKYDEQDT